MAAVAMLWLLPLVAGSRTSARTWRPSSPGFVFPEEDEVFVLSFWIQCLSYFHVAFWHWLKSREKRWTKMKNISMMKISDIMHIYEPCFPNCLVQGAGMVWSPSTALGWQRLWYSIGRWRHSRLGFGSWYPSQLAGNRTQPPFQSNRVDRFTCVMLILIWYTDMHWQFRLLDLLEKASAAQFLAHVGGLLEKAKYLSVTSGSVWLGI